MGKSPFGQNFSSSSTIIDLTMTNCEGQAITFPDQQLNLQSNEGVVTAMTPQQLASVISMAANDRCGIDKVEILNPLQGTVDVASRFANTDLTQIPPTLRIDSNIADGSPSFVTTPIVFTLKVTAKIPIVFATTTFTVTLGCFKT